MGEVRDYANRLCASMPAFAVMDESEISRIVVLQNRQRYADRWIKEYLVEQEPVGKLV